MNDFPKLSFDWVRMMQYELEEFGDICYFNHNIHKIVYDSIDHALQVYLHMQMHEMEIHKWIKSEKAHHDLGEFSLYDWISNYSENFREYWRKTHVLVE